MMHNDINSSKLKCMYMMKLHLLFKLPLYYSKLQQSIYSFNYSIFHCYTALNEALTEEVQRLKLSASGLVDAHDSTNSNQQTSLNAQTMDFRQDQ